MWTNYFDEIFLINLPGRLERLKAAMYQLAMNKIPYERVSAIKNKNGALGLYQTMIALFHYALEKKYRRILVTEDDLRFLQDPDPIMRKCIDELPKDFDLFYLGANLCGPVKKYSNNLLLVSGALATHAVAYSDEAMRLIIKERQHLPFDELLRRKIQPRKKSFCASVLLATQKEGYSDIKNFSIDWDPLLQQHWQKWTRNIIN